MKNSKRAYAPRHTTTGMTFAIRNPAAKPRSYRNKLASRSLGTLFAFTMALIVYGAAFADPVSPEAQKAVQAISIGALFGGMSLCFIVLVALPLAAMVVVLTIARPNLSDRLTEVVASQRAAAFWWGLATTILCLFAFAILAQTKVLGGLALVVLVLYAWSLLVGFMGVSREAGELFLSNGGRLSSSPTWLALVGSLLLTATAAVPLFGWIIALYVVCLSVGAFRLGWRGPKPVGDKAVGEMTG